MASVTENDSKFEVHTVVRFSQAEGVNQSDIHRRLVSACGQNVFSQREVSVWCNKFKDGRMALNDDPQKHRGRPRMTLMKIVTVEGLIRED
jgi:hypothetical protein